MIRFNRKGKASSGATSPEPQPRTPARIDIVELGKTYHGKWGSFEALAPSSLTIEPGEFVSLVGPSGCGKSTILNLVAGLITPSGGSVTIGSRYVDGPDNSVGIVFQKPTLLSWYSVLENVLLPSRIAGTYDAETEARAIQLLETTGLAGVMHRLPRELSGGMQQRASIARALVNQPSILLMDEPFSALDEFTRETLNDEVLKLWSEQRPTVLFITHSISEAVYLSDRVFVMDSGPGRIRDVVTIDLPRPRGLANRTSSDFYEYVSQIRSMIGPREFEEMSVS